MKIYGGHVSIAGGLDKSIDNGVKIGATGIQTFASSPRTLKFKEVEAETIDKYLQKKSESAIDFHVFHGIYLINLAHEDAEMRQRGVDSLIAYQQLAGKIGAEGTVFHIGSHKGKGLDTVMNQVAESVNQVLKETPENTWLLLENAAGHAGTIGQSMDELLQVMTAVEKTGHDISQLGICLDSQHAFASGIDIRDKQTVDALISDIDRDFGLEKLRLIHVNDSMTDFDSHKDRHENLGEGKIGLDGMKLFLSHEKITDIPKILEVPGKNKSGPRKEDVEQLQELIDG